MFKQWYRSPKRHLPVLALVCLGVIISALAFVTIHSLEVEKARAAFQRAAQERFDDLQSDLDLTVSKVVALGAFCESSYPVTRSSFNSFASTLYYGHDAGTQALEWVPRVSLGERAAFERSVRASGSPGFSIRDRSATGEMIVAANRDTYFPVTYVQPLAGNAIVVGYDDLASNANRRDVLMRAADTGELSASRRVTLVQETSDQYGIVIARAVYRRGGSSFDKTKLLGFATGILRLGDVVEKHGSRSGVALAVRDLGANPGEQQLYPSGEKCPPPPSSFTQYQTISLGGRSWQIVASPEPGAFRASNLFSYAGSAISLLFILLAAGYLAIALDRRWEIERLVDERTAALNAALHSLAEVHHGLEESEARYRRLVEDSPYGIAVEREGKIVLVNRAMLAMFGFDPGVSFGNRCVADYVIPARREYAIHARRELYSREMQLPPRETQVVRADGSIMDVEVAASSFRDAGALTIQLIVRDITERKLAYAENAQLVRAIEQVAEAIVVTDLDANIVYVNPAFERITGYTREEALGKNPRFLRSGLHDKDYYADLWKSLRAGQVWSGRFVNRAKNGKLLTEEVTISPVLNRSGEPINYVAVNRDVTRETQLQEQLHQSQKMDAVGRLAGGVAHDFNNMLMVIVSYAELIATSLPDDDPIRSHTAQILRAAQRSASLTRQLLAFSRKQVLAPKVLDCNSIVAETASMVRRLISENIELKCELTADLWAVKADADQIVQVILNLCVNSRDAMPEGGSLVLATRNCPVEQGFVELSVADTGIGIPLELQEKLFEPFFTTKEQGKGTGLGLATVYGIVQQSGGYIRLESAPGQGATFRVYLPRCLEDTPSTDFSADSPFYAGRSRVLVVEDEPALREAIVDHLRDHGYRVLAAVDGAEALETLAQNPNTSILISDLIMPRMGGRELASLAAKKLPHLRIIFMSGYADGMPSEPDDIGCPIVFLQKPFSMSLLLSSIAELNNRTGVRADA